MPQLWKILRIFFKIWVFNVSHDSVWRLVCKWKVQLPGVHRDFRGSDHGSLASGTSSRKKHFENFSKVFLSSALAASPGDFLATWLNREKRVFCVLWSIFFKLFEYSLDSFVTIHCLPCLFLFQNHSVHTQIFIFFIFFIPFHQSSSKGMGSISFSICVTYLVIYLLDCVFLLCIW